MFSRIVKDESSSGRTLEPRDGERKSWKRKKKSKVLTYIKPRSQNLSGGRRSTKGEKTSAEYKNRGSPMGRQGRKGDANIGVEVRGMKTGQKKKQVHHLIKKVKSLIVVLTF